ncbi:hypothetical protein [Daejeonella oryzae]|uniref:hypothetical protein n=1 Tax=Daejeonella oryzae TaxID=1122943 RepID=UPI0004235257|nr:hypothetical protein [Daejeonella oryzae]
MTIQEIDHLTERFYQSISFNTEHFPNLDQLKELFFGDGKLINANFDQVLDFTVQTFSHSLMAQIESGNATHFTQQEISDQTEIFGIIAQRISVYEYTSSAISNGKWKQGVNYIQYLNVHGKWLITSMIWKDESPDLSIPESYLDL